MTENTSYSSTRRKRSFAPRERGDRTRQRIMAYIRDYKQANVGASPTLDEIAAATTISKSNVYRHLQILAGRGDVTLDDSGKARHIGLPGERYELPE